MPVLLLTHYIKYGLIEANYFLTGPTVVDADNVKRVSALVKQGYR
jgi:simple sugar transport system substrate-binding protein